MTHTPGPWKVVYGQNGYPKEITRVKETSKKGGINAIIRWNGIGLPSSEEGRCNALLIAAAPDLLAALKDCIEAFSPDYSDTKAISFASAAIAKAEGR